MYLQSSQKSFIFSLPMPPQTYCVTHAELDEAASNYARVRRGRKVAHNRQQQKISPNNLLMRASRSRNKGMFGPALDRHLHDPLHSLKKARACMAEHGTAQRPKHGVDKSKNPKGSMVENNSKSKPFPVLSLNLKNSHSCRTRLHQLNLDRLHQRCDTTHVA